MLITMADIRAGGGCAPGLRAFFARYGLDIKAFIRDGGIDADALQATGDALAIQIVRLARAKQDNGGADGR